MAINWGDRPKRHEPTAGIRIWRVPPGNTDRHALLLLGGPQSPWTHYDATAGGTTPCEHADCPACGAVQLHYFPALLVAGTAQRLVCLELRSEAADVLRDREHRGLFAWLARVGTARYSPVRVDVVEARRIASAKLPEPFEVQPVLYRVWRYAPQAAPQLKPYRREETA